MKIELMKKIDIVPIGSVKPYENNPRINDDSVREVAASIREFGFDVPITVDKDMVIITGHTRLLAAKELNLKEVPVIKCLHLSPAKVKAYRLADNKVGEKSEWHQAKLELELVQLEEMKIDMSAFGFVRDKMKGLDFEKIQAELDEAHKHAASLPDYVYDCHTIQGKIRGKTKAQFFIEEERALTNKRPSLFDINELMK